MEEHNNPNFLSNLPERIRNLISNAVTVMLIAMLVMLLYVSYRSISIRYSGVNESSYIMGTVFEIKVNGENTVRHVQAAIRRIREIESLVNYFDEKSELSSVNNMAGISAVAVSRDTYELIDKAIRFSRRSGGAYDLTIGPLMDIWKPSFMSRKEIPSGNELAYAQHLVNYGNLVLDPADETVKLLYPGMKIDLGGAAKGYAISKARALLVERGVKSALISAGSSMAVIGDNKGRPWKVAIKHPRRPDEAIGTISLMPGQAVSTSGDYENYFMLNGKRYHHILDPATGLPAEDVMSVTIINNDATEADMLSTAVLVMGAERGMAFVRTFPDTYAVIVDKDQKVHISDGLKLER